MTETKTVLPEITEQKELSRPWGKLFYACLFLLAISFFLSMLMLHPHFNNSEPVKITTLDELNAYSAWIIEEKERVEKNGSKEDKCAVNKAITQFNKERGNFLSSPTFLEKELLLPEIEKFNIKCEEAP
ncbi:MAG: hypothetical protein WA055_01320 [Candidatus Moraniibacteriota bacterium]